MASCVALKRSFGHECESSVSPSSKRQRRCFPITVVSSSSPPNESSEPPVVFPDVQPVLSTDALFTRIKEEVLRLQRRHPVEGSDEESDLLTLKQVNLICARLLKEREEKIREEYEQILFEKLNEQHENFVRFTQDQLTRRFSELQFSYVS